MGIFSLFSAKPRRHFANTQQARRNLLDAFDAMEPTLPAWVNNKDRVDEFQYVIVKLSERKQVSAFFVGGAVRDPGTLKLLLTYAALMAKEGASFAEQQVAAVDLVVDLWANLGPEKQQRFRAVDLQNHS
jgi:hypothetical protein